MDLKTFIDQLVTFTLPLPSACGKDVQSQAVWETVLSLAQKDEKQLFSAFPFLLEYAKKNKDFSASNPPQVREKIAQLPSVSFIEQINSFRLMFSIFPFLSQENAKLFISQCIIFAQNYLITNKAIPEEFVSCMGLAETSLLDDSNIVLLFDSIKLYLTTENQCGAMIVVSFVLQDIIDTCEEAGDYLLTNVIASLKDDYCHQISGLFLLSKLNHFLAQEDTVIPVEVFHLLLQLFTSTDITLFKQSHKTMVQLIKCGVFSETIHVLDILKQFKAYNESNIAFFFKFLSKYLDDYESVPMSIVQPIYDFLLEHGTQGTPLFQAFCLEAYSLLAAVNKDVLEDIYDIELDVAKNLLATNDSLILSKVACFLLALSKTFPMTLPVILADYLPILVSFLTTETKNREDKKYKLDIAQSLSATIEGGSYPHVSGPIISFSISMIADANETEILYLGSTVLALIKEFSQEQATKTFDALSTLMLKTAISQNVNVCLHMMKKLMMKQEIDQALLVRTVESILLGNTVNLNGIPPYLAADTKTMIFYFLSAFIKKYPLKSGSYATTIASWISKTRVALLPAVLEAVEASIVASVLPPDSINEIYKVIMPLVIKVPITEEEEYCSVIEILILLIDHYPNVCDSNAILMAATQMLALCHGIDSEEEEVDPVEDTLVVPTLSRLVLSTFASTELNAEISKDLINGVLEDIPTSSMSDILPVLIKLMKQPARLKPVLVPICRLVTDVLLMNRNDLDELGINEDLSNSSKCALKEVIKGNKLIERQIAKDYSSSRGKLNRFNALIK